MAEEQQLYDNLALVASPPSAGITSPGAALSLALHCLLVAKGFTTTGPGAVPSVPKNASARVRQAAALRPPADWQAEGPNEWNTEYSLEGQMAPFKLTVSLHRNAGRVFVHASEAGNLNNIQVLGLLLDVYVPDPDVLAKATQWDQALQNAGQLVAHMNQHIISPLLRNASPGTQQAGTRAAQGPAKAEPVPLSWSDYLMGYGQGSGSQIALGAGLGLALAAAAGLWISLSRTSRSRT